MPQKAATEFPTTVRIAHLAVPRVGAPRAGADSIAEPVRVLRDHNGRDGKGPYLEESYRNALRPVVWLFDRLDRAWRGASAKFWWWRVRVATSAGSNSEGPKTQPPVPD
jgi:hypothetical protein